MEFIRITSVTSRFNREHNAYVMLVWKSLVNFDLFIIDSLVSAGISNVFPFEAI